jgi:YVTN family beta-propeller protein
MSDIDRQISEALKGTASDYEPRDLAGAQRVFVKKRRRRRGMGFAGGAVAVAAVIAAVAVFPRPELVSDDPVDVASALRVAATIPVGDSPSAVAASEDAVWVANTGEGTVSRIDPATNEVVATIEVGGSPDEVAIGGDDVWVARQDGRVVRIDAGSDAVVDRIQVLDDAGPAHLDVAAHEDWLLVAHQESGELWLVTDAGVERVRGDVSGTDVATYRAGVPWAYDGETGLLSLFREVDEDPAHITIEGAPVSEDADLAVGRAAVWVSDANGRVTRFEAQDDFGRMSIELGGRHSDLAVDAETLWAVTAQDDERGLLHQIDADTAEVLADPLQLDGEPVDVAVGGSTVWVTNRSDDTVTRIEVGPGGDPLPSPSPSDSVDEQADATGVPAIVFSRGGDIWMSDEDGALTQVTDTDVAETNPVFTKNIFGPGEEAVVFERGRAGGEGTDLFYLDVSTLEEQMLMEGARPTFWPSGTGAWMQPSGGTPAIEIGPLFSEPIDSFPAVGASDPYSVGPIAWDQSNEILFYEATGSDGPELYWADVITKNGSPVEVLEPERLDIGNVEEGSVLVAPTLSFSLGLDVIRLYGQGQGADEGSFAGAELGTIETLDSGARYEPLVDLSELGLELAPARIWLAQAGELAAFVHEDGSVEWTKSNTMSWLVGDHDQMFLVDSTGEITKLPFEVGAGASVSHRYLPTP